jgi:hypothetical protein
MTKSIVAMILLFAASGQALAADNGIYMGGSVGQSKFKIDNLDGVSAADFDGDDTAFKVIGGIRPLDWIGFEAAYVDFGHPDDTVLGERVSAKASGISGFAVGFIDIGPFDIFGKLGAINWDSSFSGGGLDSSGTDFAYGVGAQFRLLSLSIRAEYEAFDLSDIDDLNMISVGVTWTFL